MEYVVGIDIGGTGTDCVVVDGSRRGDARQGVLDPARLLAGILDAMAVAADALGLSRAELLARTSLFLHSTTVAENAVVDETLAAGGISPQQASRTRCSRCAGATAAGRA